MDGALVAAVLFILIHLLLLYLGYQIKVQQRTWLIAGYAPERVRDERGLANWVGTGILLLASFGVGIGLLFALVPEYTLALVFLYAAVTLTGCLPLVVGCRRYTKRDT